MIEQWYYSFGGQKKGPVSKDKLKEILAKDFSSKARYLVWKEGMNSWVSAENVPELGDASSPVPKSAPAKRINVAARTMRQKVKDMPKKEEIEVCAGLTRLGYNLYWFIVYPILFTILTIIVLEFVVYAGPEMYPYDSNFRVWAIFYPFIISMMISSGVILSRLKNLNYGSWRIVTLLIPGVNLWTLYALHCGDNNFKLRKTFGVNEIVCILLVLGVVALNAFTFVSKKQLVHVYVADQVSTFYLKQFDVEKDDQKAVKKWISSLNKEEKKEARKQLENAERKQQRIYNKLETLGIR